MTDALHAMAQADTPANVEVPNTAFGFAGWLMAKLGANIVFAIVLGITAKVLYDDNKAATEARYTDFKVHQVELMAYLSNRNDGETKRALADAELARSLQALSMAIERIGVDIKRTAQTERQP